MVSVQLKIYCRLVSYHKIYTPFISGFVLGALAYTVIVVCMFAMHFSLSFFLLFPFFSIVVVAVFSLLFFLSRKFSHAHDNDKKNDFHFINLMCCPFDFFCAFLLLLSHVAFVCTSQMKKSDRKQFLRLAVRFSENVASFQLCTGNEKNDDKNEF